MNTRSSNAKWLVLGLGVLTLVGCSAEASEPPSKNPGTGNTSGSANGGAGGSGTGGNVAVAGTGVSPGAGMPGTTGGTANGAAGNNGTAGAAAGTAGTGGMDGGALTACPNPPAAGTIADLLIDDLEDGDNGLSKIGSRTGFWYTYMDPNGTTITPMPDKSGTMPLKPAATGCRNDSKGCITITGTTVANDLTVVGMEKYGYAGVGFDFSNAMKTCVYNVSAYSGIRFYAKGDVAVTIKLNTTATVATADGGTCTDVCTDGFSPAGADILLDPTMWTLVDIPFATAMQAGWGTPATLDKTAVMGLQVQIPPEQTFNVSIDDVTFY